MSQLPKRPADVTAEPRPLNVSKPKFSRITTNGYCYVLRRLRICFSCFFARICIFFFCYLLQTNAAGNRSKRSLPKRRQMDECVHLQTDRTKVVGENFGNLDWLLDKLNNGSVLQVRQGRISVITVYCCAYIIIM